MVGDIVNSQIRNPSKVDKKKICDVVFLPR